jgi:hypothetical protein
MTIARYRSLRPPLDRPEAVIRSTDMENPSSEKIETLAYV